jgi:hypothetical protein
MYTYINEKLHHMHSNMQKPRSKIEASTPIIFERGRLSRG